MVQFRQGPADHLRPALVVDRLAGFDVPFPGARVRAVNDVLQAQALAPQFAFSILAFCDVELDGHEAHQQARVVVQGLDVERHPVPPPALAAVEDFAIEAALCIQRRAHLQHGVGVGGLDLKQAARRLAQRLGRAVAGDALEAFIDPGDAAAQVGDDDGVGAAPSHQRQAAQVGRHVLGHALGAQAASGLLAQQACQQQAGSQGAGQEQPGRVALLLGVEGGAAAGVQRDLAAGEVKHLRGVVLGLVVERGGGCVGACGAGGGIKHRAAAGVAIRAVEKLDMQLARAHVAQLRQEVVDQNRRIQHATQWPQPDLG